MAILAHYQLATIVFCSTSINLDLVGEFYEHLHCVSEDPLLYRTRVAKKDLDFSPDIWRTFLGCRPANNNFVCFPHLDEPLHAPFDDLTVDGMFTHFFHRPRPLRMKLFSAQGLSAADNILYKVIVGCLLPLVTRGQAYVRTSHLFLMYALRQRLEIDIALQMFHCIIHFTTPVQKKIHMPFGHLITAWLASIGIVVDRERANIKPLTDYDRIGLKNFSLAGMQKAYGPLRMEWAPGHDFHLDELGAMAVEAAEAAEAAEGDGGDAVAAEAPGIPADEEADDEDMDEYLSKSFESVDTRIEELRQEMVSGFGELRQEMVSGFDRLTSLVERWMLGPHPPPASASEPSTDAVPPPMDVD